MKNVGSICKLFGFVSNRIHIVTNCSTHSIDYFTLILSSPIGMRCDGSFKQIGSCLPGEISSERWQAHEKMQWKKNRKMEVNNNKFCQNQHTFSDGQIYMSQMTVIQLSNAINVFTLHFGSAICTNRAGMVPFNVLASNRHDHFEYLIQFVLPFHVICNVFNHTTIYLFTVNEVSFGKQLRMISITRKRCTWIHYSYRISNCCSQKLHLKCCQKKSELNQIVCQPNTYSVATIKSWNENNNKYTTSARVSLYW